MRYRGIRFRTTDTKSNGSRSRQGSTLAAGKFFPSALMAMFLLFNAGGSLPARLSSWPEKTFQINTTLPSLQFANKYFKHLAIGQFVVGVCPNPCLRCRALDGNGRAVATWGEVEWAHVAVSRILMVKG